MNIHLDKESVAYLDLFNSSVIQYIFQHIGPSRPAHRVKGSLSLYC